MKAFGFNLTNDHTALIRRMLKDIIDEEIEVVDLQCFPPEIGPTDIIVAYGRQAQRRLQEVLCRAKVGFPDPDRLDVAHGDPEEIRLAREKLAKFRDMLDSDTKLEILLKPDTIPKHCLNLTEELPKDLTASDIKKLEEQQLRQGKTHWTGSTTNGKTIRITIEPENNTADINITFAELYAVMGLRDTLRVQELEFVYKPSATIETGSTQ